MQCERCSSDHTVFARSRWLIVRMEQLRDGGTTSGQYSCDTALALSRLLVGHPQPRFEKNVRKASMTQGCTGTTQVRC